MFTATPISTPTSPPTLNLVKAVVIINYVIRLQHILTMTKWAVTVYRFSKGHRCFQRHFTSVDKDMKLGL